MRIAFVHFPGRLARLDEARAGVAPTEFLFGAVELERAGHEVSHHEVDPAAPVSGLARHAVDANAGRGLLPPHLQASVLAGTRRLLPVLRDAEVVVATTTATAMALAAWRRVRRLDRPLVGIVAGLVNAPWRATRRRTTLPLLRRMHAVLYGPGELEAMRALDPALGERVHVVPFGVDTAFWTPGDRAGHDDVVAIGNDGHRDYGTLVRAASSIPARVRILTRRPPPDGLPANVSWEEADWYTQVLSDGEVRELLRGAAAVVVPLLDVPQPSGQSATLQAMACARPVVLTRTRGLWDRESLRDGENVLLTAPGDADAIARAVVTVLDDRRRGAEIGSAARDEVERTASVPAYADRLLAVCRLAVERP
jgi:glycosyltransferase involved in cell wall biosynthesis